MYWRIKADGKRAGVATKNLEVLVFAAFCNSKVNLGTRFEGVVDDVD